MVVGVGVVELYIVDCRSLKEKRSVLSRILNATRNKFAVSIAEVGELDSWKRSIIGFSIVSNDKQLIDSRLNKIIRFIEDLHCADIVGSSVEILSMSDTSGLREFQEGKFDGF